MFGTAAFSLLTLYTVIILASYFVVRRGWIRAYPAFVVAGTLNALVMFLFSLTRGNMVMQAVVVGPTTGFLFVALGVAFAKHFREAAPAMSAATPFSVGLPEAKSLPMEEKRAA